MNKILTSFEHVEKIENSPTKKKKLIKSSIFFSFDPQMCRKRNMKKKTPTSLV